MCNCALLSTILGLLAMLCPSTILEVTKKKNFEIILITNSAQFCEAPTFWTNGDFLTQVQKLIFLLNQISPIIMNIFTSLLSSALFPVPFFISPCFHFISFNFSSSYHFPFLLIFPGRSKPQEVRF